MSVDSPLNDFIKNFLPDYVDHSVQAKQDLDRDPVAKELLSILQSGTTLKSQRDRVKLIGLLLFHKGGMSEMRRVYTLIARSYPYGNGREDGWHPREISCAWNYVGDWLD